MLPTEPQGYISIIASNLIHPIVSLVETLDDIEFRPANEVQTSPLENGYSLAITTLTVLLLESVINRMQYVMKITPPKKAIEFVKEEFPDLLPQVEELFVMRDLIAHNHVWEASVFWDESGKLKLVNAELRRGYGDRKFNKVVNLDTRKTKILGLNVFPNKICGLDAKMVLATAFIFLCAVEGKSYSYFNTNTIIVKYKEEAILFRDFMLNVIKPSLQK